LNDVKLKSLRKARSTSEVAVMVKLVATIKAIITRIFFGAHGALAIWQVTQYKKNPIYWSLSAPIGLLVIEGFFTLGIKKNQEWRW
jgi:Transmembrane protein 26